MESLKIYLCGRESASHESDERNRFTSQYFPAILQGAHRRLSRTDRRGRTRLNSEKHQVNPLLGISSLERVKSTDAFVEAIFGISALTSKV